MSRRSSLGPILLATVLASAGCTRERSPAQLEPPTEQLPATASHGAIQGLVLAPGHELVLQNCVRCHGPQQFLQQRGDAETWLGLIRWMQRDHGLGPMMPDVEDRIVAYLAKHYGTTEVGRRRPIPAQLMPPNPYASSADHKGN